jgi:hypothetical protein
MRTRLSILSFVSAIAITTAFAQSPSPTASSPAYGTYPANYKEIVLKWLDTQLLDASSARIEWNGDPKPADLKDQNGGQLHGYLVNFKVNARNRFGAYTGMQSHGALIHDGEVIKGVGFGY